VDEEVQRVGVLIYGISLRTDEQDQALPPLREFAQLARNSGGRAIAVRDLTTLDDVYAGIAAELRHMYRLAYVPATPTHDGRWRSVAVRVLEREARVRTRAGYYAPAAATPRAGGQP
jgi:VWFA-related protein